jgi:hypothetical protein
MTHTTALELLQQARDIIGQIETLDTESDLCINVDAFTAVHRGIESLEASIRDASWHWHEEEGALLIYRQYQGKVYSLVGVGYGATVVLPNGYRIESDGVSLPTRSDAKEWVQREFDRLGVK